VELWDVYTADRKATGRTHRRGEALPPGDYHLAVFIWIRDASGRYVITRRHPDKPWGLYWECTGGSVVAGEDSLAGALREVSEEIGARLDPGAGRIVERYALDGDSLVDVWLFEAELELGTLRPQEGEVVEIRKAEATEVRAMLKSGAMVPSLRRGFEAAEAAAPRHRELCYRCLRPKRLCLCPAEPPMETRTRVVLLMHPMEYRHERCTTGRLTCLNLANSEIIPGLAFGDHPRYRALVDDPGNYPVLLYPGTDAYDLSSGGFPGDILGDRRLVVFLIDSTWACAKAILRESPCLLDLPCVKFTPSEPSRYVIKRQPGRVGPRGGGRPRGGGGGGGRGRPRAGGGGGAAAAAGGGGAAS